jgi:excisionase family DNA binding protein
MDTSAGERDLMDGPNEQAQPAEWLTVEQVAEQLQINPETVRVWIRKGELPVLDLGSRRMGYRILREELDRFIASHYGPVRPTDEQPQRG